MSSRQEAYFDLFMMDDHAKGRPDTIKDKSIELRIARPGSKVSIMDASPVALLN